MSDTVRPKIVVSRCIEFDRCRWNGLIIRSDAVKIFKPYFDFIPVCPEMEVGLGCPRDPIRIVDVEGTLRLIQPTTERDLTDSMKQFASGFLEKVGDIDGFLLKHRSPSCGIGGVKIYKDIDSKQGKGTGKGLFATSVFDVFDGLPIEDEGRLKNFGIRENFLTRIYAEARFKPVRKAGTMGALVKYHTVNKMLLSACNQKEYRLMGRIVANHEKKPAADVLDEYGDHLRQALARSPRITTNINVLMHALGYFKEDLSSLEKAFFLDSLEQYRKGMVPLSVCTTIIRSWIIRFGEDYLASQTFFEPFPEDLVAISDSGAGRRLR